jgi:4-amino-4-deoxy-L-arabinose transferase-like glycosyltransferase
MTGSERVEEVVPMAARPVALAPAVAVPAAALLCLLLATSTRYGYHRDELYFIAAGGHPAFGYPDQPPLVPLLCRAAQLMAPGSLLVLRLPSALAATATVVLAALICRELGGSARAQLIAGSVTACSGITLATGHFVTTTTFDLMFTSLLCWLLIRALVTHRGPPLLAAGVVTGIGVQAKPQVGFVAVVLLACLAVLGPRWPLRSRWLLAGAAAAAALAAPYLWWQAGHDWPQLRVAAHVAGSAEGGRFGFLPFQLVLVGPLLSAVWIAGLLALWRRPVWRPLRFAALTYLVLAAAYLIGNGKAYYLASVYSTLIGAGAVPVQDWLARGRSARTAVAAAGLAVSVAISVLVGLPLLPQRALAGSIPLALNPDLGETVGWPQLVGAVGRVWTGLPGPRRRRAVIFTSNYGEAGAIDLLGPAGGLPPAYSGHNAFGLWGPPPDGSAPVVVVGLARADAEAAFTGCTVAAQITTPDGIHDQENGTLVIICQAPRTSWRTLWPSLTHLD